VNHFQTGEKDMATVLKLGSPLKVLVFSWNVGNKMPDEAELALWCPEGGGDFDLIVVSAAARHLSYCPSTTPMLQPLAIR
jgi:hypothetical protein